MSTRWPEEPLLDRKVSPETILLAVICLLDLVTTLFLVARGLAHEGNPWMARLLRLGLVPFIIGKVAMFAPALVLAEWYRPRNPGLITWSMRIVTAGYVLLYLAGIAPYLAHFIAGIVNG